MRAPQTIFFCRVAPLILCVCPLVLGGGCGAVEAPQIEAGVPGIVSLKTGEPPEPEPEPSSATTASSTTQDAAIFTLQGNEITVEAGGTLIIADQPDVSLPAVVSSTGGPRRTEPAQQRPLPAPTAVSFPAPPAPSTSPQTVDRSQPEERASADERADKLSALLKSGALDEILKGCPESRTYAECTAALMDEGCPEDWSAAECVDFLPSMQPALPHGQ